MAIMPRKLFPTSNQTTNCHDVCDSTCPYGCYPYPDMDYYMPPPTTLLPPPQTQPQSTNKQVQNNSPYIIISVTLFVSLFLLISYYIIIVKNCSNWNRRRPSRTREQQGVNEEFLDENQGPIVDHPIWYINTIGLQPSMINLITIFKYNKGDGLIDGTECSVCLNEFQDDDSLRLLPKCNHGFHINCIDTWLRSHTNCPLCRAPIISNTDVAPTGSIVPFSSTNTSPNEENGSQRDMIVEMNNTNQDRIEEFQENTRNVRDDQDGFQEIVRVETSKNDVQPMRRSVSMDSSIATSIGIQTSVVPKGEGEKSCVGNSNSRIQRVIESASSLKRSLSYGGRSFFLKNHRNPNSVLPL